MSNSITATATDSDQELVMVVNKKKFPWWILLLLIPLILLIPVKRDIRMQFIDQNSLPVSMTPAQAVYPAVSTFGAKTPTTVSDSTSAEGKMDILGVSEPLWYRLMGGNSDSLYATCGNGCYAIANAGYRYKDFKSDEYYQLKLSAVTSQLTLKTVDADDNEPLPDCDIQIIKSANGNSASDNTKSGVAGTFDINDMPSCGSVKVVASHEGYHNDTLEATLFDISNMGENERTLHLRPMKGTVKVIVKNLETKTLLANATVRLDVDGASQTLKTNTNGVGVGTFDSLRITSTIKFTASKAGYADTTLEGYTVARFMNLSEEQRTMYLRPLTKSLVFINTDGNNVLEGVKNNIYKNGQLTATEYSNSKGEFAVNGIMSTDKISIVASKSGYSTNSTKVKNKTLNELNTQVSRTIPLSKITPPPPPPPSGGNKQDDLKGQSGDLRVNLQWYCRTDLDLHVIDPCGNEIFYSKRKATCSAGTGNLDLDANALFGTTLRPQENIYWLKPTPGTYTIKVVCFKWREWMPTPISFNISIVDKNGRVDKRGTIAAGQTVTVIKHTVTN